MPEKRSVKVLNPNQPTEQLGLIFVQQIAHAIKAIWRPTPNDDYGLDGELELTRSGEVTGYILKVQVKSGSSYMRNRSGSGFDFHVSKADTTYWGKANVPIILVVYDPVGKVGYWVDVKRYIADNETFKTTSTIRFSLRNNVLAAESILDLSETAIPDESERTDFLVDQIREKLHSNMLPVKAVPPAIFEAEFSTRRLADAIESGVSLAKEGGGKYLGFGDPTSPASPVRAYVDPTTVQQHRYPHYLQRSALRNYAVGKWNAAVRSFLSSRQLVQKDQETYYFAPNSDGSARSVVWESTRGRTPERKVAYPYIGKQSGSVAFWVHHACRVSFCEIGTYFFLRLTPAYVFTRDGKQLLASDEAGALSTSRKSKDRNYQVLNHLMFWLWFLSEGKREISFNAGDSEVIVEASFWGGESSFGVPADKRSLIEIIAASSTDDWGELEGEDATEELAAE